MFFSWDQIDVSVFTCCFHSRHLHEMRDAKDDEISWMACAYKTPDCSFLWPRTAAMAIVDVAQWTSYTHRTLAYDHRWLDMYMHFRWIFRVSFEFYRMIFTSAHVLFLSELL